GGGGPDDPVRAGHEDSPPRLDHADRAIRVAAPRPSGRGGNESTAPRQRRTVQEKPVTTGARRTIVVIGAGIVGLTTALELQKHGHYVRVVDPGSPGGRQSASYGHGAWINPASVMPTSLPGLWKQVPGMMRDPVGPF